MNIKEEYRRPRSWQSCVNILGIIVVVIVIIALLVELGAYLIKKPCEAYQRFEEYTSKDVETFLVNKYNDIDLDGISKGKISGPYNSPYYEAQLNLNDKTCTVFLDEDEIVHGINFLEGTDNESMIQANYAQVKKIDNQLSKIADERTVVLKSKIEKVYKYKVGEYYIVLTSIGSDGFFNCSRLTNITICDQLFLVYLENNNWMIYSE